jgi:hypothetical protein
MREKIQETGLTRRIAVPSVLPAEPAGTRSLPRPQRTDHRHPQLTTDRLFPSRPQSPSLFPCMDRSSSLPDQTSPSLSVATPRYRDTIRRKPPPRSCARSVPHTRAGTQNVPAMSL